MASHQDFTTGEAMEICDVSNNLNDLSLTDACSQDPMRYSNEDRSARFSTRQQPVNQSGEPQCTDFRCPISFPHSTGLYRHDGAPPHSSGFGMSNPPLAIWAARQRCLHGTHSEQDIRKVREFRRHHAGTENRWEWRLEEERWTMQLRIRIQRDAEVSWNKRQEATMSKEERDFWETLD